MKQTETSSGGSNFWPVRVYTFLAAFPRFAAVVPARLVPLLLLAEAVILALDEASDMDLPPPLPCEATVADHITPVNLKQSKVSRAFLGLVAI